MGDDEEQVLGLLVRCEVCGVEDAVSADHAVKRVVEYDERPDGAVAVLMRINRNARVVVCGGISQYTSMASMRGPANYLQLVAQSATMQGFTMLDFMGRVPEAFMALRGWSSSGKLQFRDHVLGGISAFPKAFNMLFAGENQGKLLIDLEAAGA